MRSENSEEDVVEIIDGKKYLRLYYFMPAEHFLDVIENDELKVSIPEQCNDPLEFMACGASLHEEHDRENGAFISFSRRCDSSIMWAHYADSHRGVCLEFLFPVQKSGRVQESDEMLPNGTRYAILDIDELHKGQYITLDGSHHYPIMMEVVYAKNRPNRGIGISGLYVNGVLEEVDISHEFYTKSHDWKYEREWRLMVDLVGSASYKNGLFFIKGLTIYISRIILGVRYPDSQDLVWGRLQQVIKNNPLYWGGGGKRIHYPQVRRAAYADDTYQIEIRI